MKNPSETVNDILNEELKDVPEGKRNDVANRIINELGLDKIEYISLKNFKGRPTSFKISKDGDIYV